MAESVLLRYEKPFLMEDAKLKMKDWAVKGTLILSSIQRIVFVRSEGTLRKKYDINHNYNLKHIINDRTEKKLIGKRLVIDVLFKEGPQTLRYEGISVPELWVKKIHEMQDASKFDEKGIAYEKRDVERVVEKPVYIEKPVVVEKVTEKERIISQKTKYVQVPNECPQCGQFLAHKDYSWVDPMKIKCEFCGAVIYVQMKEF